MVEVRILTASLPMEVVKGLYYGYDGQSLPSLNNPGRSITLKLRF